MPSADKKSSLRSRFTDMINAKSPRRGSLSKGSKQGGATPPTETSTPPPSSPRSVHLRNNSSPTSTRYTFDENHRLPVTFLPFVATDTSFMKGLEIFGETSGSSSSSFEFSDSPVDREDGWFSLSGDQSSAYNTPERKDSLRPRDTNASPEKDITIGWICEDGFKPIGVFD